MKAPVAVVAVKAPVAVVAVTMSDGGLLHLQEGRLAADAALIPPTSLSGVEARAELVDIYCR